MRFTFLSYAPRSGSTKLADMLDGVRSDLLVLPELRTPIWLVEAMCRDGLSVDVVASILDRDPQATELGLRGTDIARELTGADGSSTREVGFRPVLEAIVRVHVRNLGTGTPTSVVVKHGRSVEHFEAIHGALGSARLLHLVRDPRGVANSMSRTIVPRDPVGANFARNNPLYPVRLWRRRQRAFAELHELFPTDTRMVRFGDIGDESAVAELAAWVADDAGSGDLRGRVTARSSRRSRPIPHREHSIHELASEPFRSDRDEAWRSELDPRIARHIEVLLWGEMTELGLIDGAAPSVVARIRARTAYLVRWPIEVSTRARTVVRGRFAVNHEP